jgi:hypothetical protein
MHKRLSNGENIVKFNENIFQENLGVSYWW